MPSLIAYRKVTDAITTHQLALPESAEQGVQAAQELATLADGRTVVVIFEGHELPDGQPKPIESSIERLPLPLPDELREAIREASPHVRLINRRVQDRIRARYSIEDEMKFSRLLHKAALGLQALTDADKAEVLSYDKHVEEARTWGKQERAKLGV